MSTTASTLRFAVLAAALAAAVGPGRALAAEAPARGPALAVEDTMRTEVPPVLVAAPRVTLDEILARVARGEAHRDSLIRDETFLVSIRVVGHTGEGQKPQLLEESVEQVWKRRPGQSRSLELRHWYLHPPKKQDLNMDVQVSAGDDMSETIVNFAFRPESRHEFTFKIVGRDILGDHLVYRIAFEPRSPLSLELPGGTVWVDTRDDVIVRQEIEFRQSPIPLFVRGIRRLVVERQRVGDTWVLSRVLARVETTIPLPRYGSSFDFGLQFTQYALNAGVPDSVFAHPAAHAKQGGR